MFLAGCGSSGSDTPAEGGAPADGPPAPVDTASTADAGAGMDTSPEAGDTAAGGACRFDRESPDDKLAPGLVTLFAANPGPRKVLIGFNQQPATQTLPECQNCGGCQTCAERTAALSAIEREVTEIQKCVLERVKALGGEFLERFALSNVTLVRLDRTQALEVAALTDVRAIEDAED
jgi:hypothetical protein